MPGGPLVGRGGPGLHLPGAPRVVRQGSLKPFLDRWFTIALPTPFLWSGTSDLLVEVAHGARWVTHGCASVCGGGWV